MTVITALGIECTKSSIMWAVIRGTTADNAALVECAKSEMPKNALRPLGLNWAYHEMIELERRFNPDEVIVKRAELGQNMRQANLEHAELDGVVLAALYEVRVSVQAIPWATLARRLSATNKASALAIVQSSAAGSAVPAVRHTAVAAALSIFGTS